jgi:hypothetical protein
MDPVSPSPRFSCKLSDIKQYFCSASLGPQRSGKERGALHWHTLLLPCVAASSKPLLRQLLLLLNSCTGSHSLARSLALPLFLSPSLPPFLLPSLPPSLPPARPPARTHARPPSLPPSRAHTTHPPVLSAVSSHMSTLVLGPELFIDDGRGTVVGGSCSLKSFC